MSEEEDFDEWLDKFLSLPENDNDDYDEFDEFDLYDEDEEE